MTSSNSYAALGRGLLAVLGISATFEVAPLFLASRFLAIDDTIYYNRAAASGWRLHFMDIAVARAAPDSYEGGAPGGRGTMEMSPKLASTR